MTPTVHVSAEGVAIAVVFASAMAALLVWMFSVPRPVRAEVARARRALDVARVILAPTISAPYSQRGVELACRLAQEQKAEVLLVHVIEVPRTLPLDMPLREAERQAREALDTARDVVAMHGLPVRTLVQRARGAADGIIAAARDNDADLIVVSIGPRRGALRLWGSTAEALFNRAPCEVIFDKLPE